MTLKLEPLTFIKNLSDERANIAEKWWWAIKGAQFTVLALGIGVVLTNDYSHILGAIAVLLTIFASLAEWRFAYQWHISQAIKRKYEFWNGLGWTISGTELANLQASMPKSLRKRLEKAELYGDDYFASSKKVSSQRLTENLLESSWWTKHLARQIWLFSIFVTFLVLIVSITILSVALQNGSNQTTGVLISKIVVSVIVFMFTAGFFRTSFDYHRLYKEAELIETKADMLLSHSEVEPKKAIALYTDYQFLRETSPPILSIVWRSMNASLNDSWDQHNRNKSGTTVSSHN